MKPKRLFLFAGYDKNGKIDSALIYYVRALNNLGDVVVFMDSDCPKSELKKLDKITLYAHGVRHGEYDFGSYKRAYIWATENLNLADYDFVYMVNDSVYGPLYDITPYLERMENIGTDAFGMVKNPKPDHPHIQSWFIGLRPSVFLTDWYDNFIRAVKKLESKGLITREYEHGLSRAITAHNLTWACLYTVKNRGIYNHVKKLYRARMPFIKKLSFTRHNGSLGRQILYVLNHIDDDARIAITLSVRQQYGTKYTKWLLTKNPIKIMFRHIKHTTKKLLSGRL